MYSRRWCFSAVGMEINEVLFNVPDCSEPGVVGVLEVRAQAIGATNANAMLNNVFFTDAFPFSNSA